MKPKLTMVGIVIRPDGTVPFEDGFEYRAEVLEHLTNKGHTLEPIHGTKHVRIKDWKSAADAR